MKKHFILRPFIFLTFIFSIQLCSGQATRTWISGVGDDVNPCSRTAPCKTFAGAISKTASPGEINALDPGGFGTVTITKSITLDGGGAYASILASTTNGIIINAPDAIINIRNISINGAGTTLGINGIRILAARKVLVENCTISNFSGKGIEIQTTVPCTVILDNVTIHNVVDGIGITNASGSVMAEDCRFQSISNAGISLVNGKVTVSNSNISDCAIGIATQSNSSVFLSNNTITNNNIALQGQGKISSAGNNTIIENKTQGATVSVIKLQ